MWEPGDGILSSLVTVLSAHSMQGTRRSRKSQASLCHKRLIVQLGRGDLHARLNASGKSKMVVLSSSSRGHRSEPKWRPPDVYAYLSLLTCVYMSVRPEDNIRYSFTALELTKEARLAGQRVPRVHPTLGFQACTTLPSFCYVGSGDQTQVSMLLRQALYLLRHIPSSLASNS